MLECYIDRIIQSCFLVKIDDQRSFILVKNGFDLVNLFDFVMFRFIAGVINGNVGINMIMDFRILVV